MRPRGDCGAEAARPRPKGRGRAARRRAAHHWCRPSPRAPRETRHSARRRAAPERKPRHSAPRSATRALCRMAAMSCGHELSRRASRARARSSSGASFLRAGRPLRARRTAAGATADAASADASAADPNLDPAVHEAVYASDTRGPREPPPFPGPAPHAWRSTARARSWRRATARARGDLADFNTGPAEPRLDEPACF